MGLAGAFSSAYRVSQKSVFAGAGLVGPISIYDTLHPSLFVTYAATKSPSLHLPWGRHRAQIAEFLYRAIDRIKTYVVGAASQSAIRRQIDFLRRVHRLPPLVVSVLPIPRISSIASRLQKHD